MISTLSHKASQLERSGSYAEAYDIYSKLYSDTGLNVYRLALERITMRLRKHKSVYQSLKKMGIQKCYALSLNSQPYKRFLLAREMSRPEISIPIEIINAVHGRTDLNAMNAYFKFQKREPGKIIFSDHISREVQQNMKSYVSPNAYGYFMTMKNIFQDAIANKYDRIAVFDDDIVFTDNASEKLANLVANNTIPFNWKVLHLGASEYGSRIHDLDPEIENLYKPSPGETCGSFAACYDKSVYSLLLELANEPDGTFDNNSLGYIYHTFPDETFVVFPNICFANVQTSDIRSSRNQATHSSKMRWIYTDSRLQEYNRPQKIHVLFPDKHSACNAIRVEDKRLPMGLVPFYLSTDGIRPVHHQNTAEDTENTSECNGFYVDHIKKNIKMKGESLHSLGTFTFHWNSYKEEFSFLRLAEFLNSQFSSPSQIEISSSCGSLHSFRRVTRKGLCTVVIPIARNTNIYLSAVESVCNQSYKEIELVIVIDNPEIDRDRVLKSTQSLLANKDCSNFELQVIKHSRKRYACAARNTGFFSSKGEFISFLDEDDVYLEDRISSCMLELQNKDNQKYDACYCGYKGSWNGDFDESRFRQGSLFKEILTLSYKKHYICTNTITFRSSALEFLGGFNESYVRHQDIELMLRFFKCFHTTSVNYIGVHNCPSPREDTFTPDLVKIIQLKKHLIANFADDIHNLEAEDIRLFFEGHAKDISRHILGLEGGDRMSLALKIIEGLIFPLA